MLVEVAEKSAHACDALFAMNYFLKVQHGQLDQNSYRAYQAILFGKTCSEYAVGTSATIGPVANKPGKFGRVVIGTHKLMAQIDEKAGTSAITIDKALELGLALTETQLEGLALGELVRGPLATVPELRLGDLVLKNVDVIVIDTLANQAELVLGFNALWRLQPAARGDKVVLTPWKL
ncbi:MAG: aspartyl protease family protein [Myxococcales bacterium]|nr:aspartyl protease family protein [Myxococcales bacterium]